LYYVLPASLGGAAFDDANGHTSWQDFAPGKCALLTAGPRSAAAQGLREGMLAMTGRGLGWEAMPVDPQAMRNRMIDDKARYRDAPSYARAADVVIDPLERRRRAVLVKIVGIWDTRYVLIVPVTPQPQNALAPAT
jgi:hypothetical protein